MTHDWFSSTDDSSIGNIVRVLLVDILLFLIVINDLQPPCETIKFVDDTSSYDINNSMSNKLQDCATYINRWSSVNNMLINKTKTKELVICFKQNVPTIPHLVIEDQVIERVTSVKLLGLYIRADLIWATHVNYIYKKVSTRIYNLIVLRRAGLSCNDLFKIYTSMIRSVLEYAAPVWHPGLTSQESELLESIQKRCLKLICPNLSYKDALLFLKTESLVNRRSLCKDFFVIMQDTNHKLHSMLQERDHHGT